MMWDGFSTRPRLRSGRPSGGGRVENPSHMVSAGAEHDETSVVQPPGTLAQARLGADQIELGGEEVFARLRVAEEAAPAEKKLRLMAFDGPALLLAFALVEQQ